MASSGSDSGAQLRAEEDQRQRNILAGQKQVDALFVGFDEPFFKARETAYTKYAVPQLAEQFQDEKRNLSYALARRGLLRSSAQSTLSGKLEDVKNQQLQQIADMGVEQANKLRKDVESSRTGLYSQIQAGLSPTIAKSQALREASAFTQPTAFEPVVNSFADFSKQYMNPYLISQYSQGAGGSSGTPDFASKGGTIKYVNG